MPPRAYPLLPLDFGPSFPAPHFPDRVGFAALLFSLTWKLEGHVWISPSWPMCTPNTLALPLAQLALLFVLRAPSSPFILCEFGIPLEFPWRRAPYFKPPLSPASTRLSCFAPLFPLSFSFAPAALYEMPESAALLDLRKMAFSPLVPFFTGRELPFLRTLGFFFYAFFSQKF